MKLRTLVPTLVRGLAKRQETLLGGIAYTHDSVRGITTPEQQREERLALLWRLASPDAKRKVFEEYPDALHEEVSQRAHTVVEEMLAGMSSQEMRERVRKLDTNGNSVMEAIVNTRYDDWTYEKKLVETLKVLFQALPPEEQSSLVMKNTKKGHSPLSLLIGSGHKQVAEIMIKALLPVQKATLLQETDVLHMATYRGWVKGINMLLEDLSAEEAKKVVNSFADGPHGNYTPLISAVDNEENGREVAKVLLEYGADVTVKGYPRFYNIAHEMTAKEYASMRIPVLNTTKNMAVLDILERAEKRRWEAVAKHEQPSPLVKEVHGVNTNKNSADKNIASPRTT